MTAFCSHQVRDLTDGGRSPIAYSSQQQDARRLGALVRCAIGHTIAAFGSRIDRSLEPVAHGNSDPDSDASRFPQRPLILGDRWDF